MSRELLSSNKCNYLFGNLSRLKQFPIAYHDIRSPFTLYSTVLLKNSDLEVNAFTANLTSISKARDVNIRILIPKDCQAFDSG